MPLYYGREQTTEAPKGCRKTWQRTAVCTQLGWWNLSVENGQTRPSWTRNSPMRSAGRRDRRTSDRDGSASCPNLVHGSERRTPSTLFDGIRGTHCVLPEDSVRGARMRRIDSDLACGGQMCSVQRIRHDRCALVEAGRPPGVLGAVGPPRATPEKHVC